MAKQITPLQIDLLKELVNIGGGHAATSLSQLIGQPVDMNVPLIEIMSYDQLYETVLTEETLIYGVLTKVLGDAGGVFLFAIEEVSAFSMAAMLLGETFEKTPEMIESAVKELVNILVNSFLNAVCRLLDVQLISSVPYLEIDMFGAIISSLYMQLEEIDEQVMIIKNEFYYLGERLDASLYFIPKPGVLEQLFTLMEI